MLRAAAQIIFGLMLFFGTITVFLKGAFYIRRRIRLRGFLYMLISAVLFIFSMFSFLYAYYGL